MDKGRLKMGQYKGMFENRIINTIRERIDERVYMNLNRCYLFNANEGNGRYLDYVGEFEEDRIRMINEVVDAISDMKIEEVIEKIDVNNIEENAYDMRAGIDFDYKVYNLEIRGEIESYTGESIKGVVKIPYVSELSKYSYNGETEVSISWI